MLSGSIIASNEESNIQRCLESIKGLASEIILVHNDITDKTLEIAEKYKVICHEAKWQGYRNQKNIALQKCSNEWILSLDCDEEISEELMVSISNFLTSDASKTSNGASFNRCSFFMGKWIRHGDWYPDRKVRITRVNKGAFKGDPTHDKLMVEGKVMHLNGDLLHYSYPDLNAFLLKTVSFSKIGRASCRERV